MGKRAGKARAHQMRHRMSHLENCVRVPKVCTTVVCHYCLQHRVVKAEATAMPSLQRGAVRHHLVVLLEKLGLDKLSPRRRAAQLQGSVKQSPCFSTGEVRAATVRAGPTPEPRLCSGPAAALAAPSADVVTVP